MATAKLRYITKDRDRHGNVRRYFRPNRNGTKTRLAEPFQSEAFWRHYAACLEAHAKGEPIPPAPSPNASDAPPAHARITPGTWRWLCAQYFASPAFKAFDRISQRTRRGILEKTCLEPIAPGDKRTFGEMPLKHFGRRAVVVLRDRKAATPGAANNRVKAIRAVFKWAMESALPGIDENPARHVPKLQVEGAGFHSWTREEVEKFRAHHAIGTTPLATALEWPSVPQRLRVQSQSHQRRTGRRRRSRGSFQGQGRGPTRTRTHQGDPWAASPRAPVRR